jgi:hypothetical protein
MTDKPLVLLELQLHESVGTLRREIDRLLHGILVNDFVDAAFVRSCGCC